MPAHVDEVVTASLILEGGASAAASKFRYPFFLPDAIISRRQPRQQPVTNNQCHT